MGGEPERDVVTNPPTDAERPDLYGILIAGSLIVVVLGVLALWSLAFFKGQDTAAGIIAISSTAAAALAGMLAVRKVA